MNRRSVVSCIGAAIGLMAIVPGTLAQSSSGGGVQNTAKTARPAMGGGIEGEWEGALQAGESQLKLVLHLSAEKSGEIHAKLDSPEQAVYGMEATEAVFELGNLHFAIASVNAAFDGKLGADGRTISGTWKQGSANLPLVLHRRSAAAKGRMPVNAISPVEGTWQGAFQNGNMRFRLQLHIAHDDERKLTGMMDSLDQGANGLPMSKLSEANGEVHFEIAMVSGVYQGMMNAARNAIAGKWSQNQDSVALEFKRSDEVLALRRPQNPAKPYPYKEEEVQFSSAKGTVTLRGTLTIPPGAGPFPAALLVAGSGPQNRDEAIAGHSPYLVLSDHLTRHGIAVLRYDKRGIGKSTGDFSLATTEDFAADAEAAVAYLRSRKEIAAGKIGVIGHSEGGLIAPILGGSGSAAWIVLLAAPAQAGEQVMLEQSEAIAGAAGMPQAQVLSSLDFDRQAYALVRSEKDSALLEKRLDAMVTSSGIAEGAVPASVQAQIHMLSSPWFRYFLDYDPLPALRKVKCPVLALNGERDLQVIAKENLSLIQKTLEDAGNKDVTTREMPQLNHLLQHAESGTPAEYGAIEETISPEVLELIENWAAKHNK
ncbi:MAG: alpha/beta hydrolase [Acidobacteria bacterium]|nr:alpha/beta hydrolase [Acidobacteriota bacterium]MBS1866545.1 alpha/beta hydrolase [Acidobacteriota bacterium]